MPGPPFSDQVRSLQTYLRRELPSQLTQLFLEASPLARRLLPLATGREDEGPTGAESFIDVDGRFESVLGYARGNADLARVDSDHVWPPGLLVIENVGCGIYNAVDLDHSQLRLLQYEHLEPVDDPEFAIGPDELLAYSEPVVPRPLQHRFVVIADSLDQWTALMVG